MRVATLLAVLALAPLPDAVAQDLPLHYGQRVRVTRAELNLDNTEATVLAVRRDTLILRVGVPDPTPEQTTRPWWLCPSAR